MKNASKVTLNAVHERRAPNERKTNNVECAFISLTVLITGCLTPWSDALPDGFLHTVTLCHTDYVSD